MGKKATYRIELRNSPEGLAYVGSILGLTRAETAQLFGVTVKTMGNWCRRGVPARRLSDVEHAAQVAYTLKMRFFAERIPKIVRQPLPGLGNRSILEAMQGSGTQMVLEMLERAISYNPR